MDVMHSGDSQCEVIMQGWQIQRVKQTDMNYEGEEETMKVIVSTRRQIMHTIVQKFELSKILDALNGT